MMSISLIWPFRAASLAHARGSSPSAVTTAVIRLALEFLLGWPVAFDIGQAADAVALQAAAQ